MSAFIISARITAAAAAVLCFVASCGQLLGDYEVTRQPTIIGSNRPDSAAPLPIICDAGVTECQGRLLQLCTDGGTAWATLEVCATTELCESSDTSTVSSCIKPTCAAEQMSCDANLLRLCNAARNGWELFATCESEAHCDAGAKQCLPAPCEPGDRRCNVGNLERCNDDRTAWEPLDTCETNELCEATLAPAAAVGEVLSTNVAAAPEPASDAQGPIECRGPVCIPREVRCDVARLIACNEGQTDLTLAEECATPALCDASITYTGLRGSPRCVRPTCAAGEHRCTEAGVLEVCNAERNGYDAIEACIGPPFCNAVAADNGGPGCEDAPCDPGEQQCNGPQIQTCSADQTQFVANVAACETRGLCNDDNPQAAFCQAAVCQRGPFSGTEFRCEGAGLLRCNDQHTGYDPLATCATPALCNAGLGFNGCQPPVCAPGETRCSGNFVQRCNNERTAFVNIEQCAAGTCDSALGRCADPCVPGTARCNAQGNLEECRDPLVGRQTTALCGSPQLCDAAARSCRTPPPGCTADGVRRCRQQGATSVLEVCTDGRSRFATLDSCAAGEICDPNDITCDTCVQGSPAACEGNVLVTCAANGQSEDPVGCPNGCLPVATGADRCLNCTPGSAICEGRQLVVCRQRNGIEVLDREDCATAALCETTLDSCSGENCRCQTSVCDVGERRCNGGQPEVCNQGQTGFVADGASCGAAGNCNQGTGRCFACSVGDVACSAGQLLGCAQDRSGFTVPLGTQRCVSDNGGDRTQSCNGSTLLDIRCAGATPECNPGSGCGECDPSEFEPSCAAGDAVTRCNGGAIENDACEDEGGCTEGVCPVGAIACTTRSSDRGTPCTRPGGLPGFCDGIQGSPSCVPCVNASQCNDNLECTTDICAANGTCQNALRTGEDCSAGVCNGNVCAQCADDGDCDDGNDCTADECSAGACSSTPQSGACVGPLGAGVCSGTRCVQCAVATDCPDDTNQCTARACTNEACGFTDLDDQACTVAGGGAGVCNGNLCTAVQVCTPNQGTCDGAVLQTCNAAGTGFTLTDTCTAAALCTPTGCLTCVGNVGCGDGQICQNNACVAACVDAINCPDDPDVCLVQVCNANGIGCAAPTGRDGGSCLQNGDTGTCVSGNCIVPTGGGQGGEGGAQQGGGAGGDEGGGAGGDQGGGAGGDDQAGGEGGVDQGGVGGADPGGG